MIPRKGRQPKRSTNMASWCTSKRLQLFSVIVAVVVIVTVLLILFISNWPSFARQKIVENLVFKNGTLGMQRFQNTSELRNLRLSISVFSVTNVDEVIKSAAKMQLKEYGPFVYHEFKWKEFLDNNQETGLITYKLRRRFVFKPELSAGDPKSINITWLNVPMLSAITFIEKLNPFVRPFAQTTLKYLISKEGEQPFITDTIENFIFSGSYRVLFAKLYKELEDVHLAKLLKNWPLPDNKFAILYNRNNTWLPNKDYIFTAATGFGQNQNYTHLNQYKLMNGSSTLPFWKDSPGHCNHFEGTDGEFFSPFLNYNASLTVYSIDICRKLKLKFRNKVMVNGISVHRYTLDEKSLQSAKTNPENSCYCLDEDATLCEIDGLIDLSKCVADNVYASGSHFINGSPELLSKFSGLRAPNLTLDEPLIHIEPNAGLAIQELNPLIVPLLTVTESAELEDDQATLLREKLLILDSWLISMVLGGAIVLILVIIVVISVLCMKFRAPRFTPAVPNGPTRPTERDRLLGPQPRNQTRRPSRSTPT